jgi:hypothetical protein
LIILITASLLFACIPSQEAKIEDPSYAPFPALMYCFSIIDLLGSLMAGTARGGNTTDNARRYMEKYLDIPLDKVRLLQKIYRHKLVHLSQPKFAMLTRAGNVKTYP